LPIKIKPKKTAKIISYLSTFKIPPVSIKHRQGNIAAQ
jgi:hypothetical protein